MLTTRVDHRERFQAALPDGPPGLMLKVLSDIDDTLMCSGGKYPAGVDRRLPKCAMCDCACPCMYAGILSTRVNVMSTVMSMVVPNRTR